MILRSSLQNSKRLKYSWPVDDLLTRVREMFEVFAETIFNIFFILLLQRFGLSDRISFIICPMDGRDHVGSIKWRKLRHAGFRKAARRFRSDFYLTFACIWRTVGIMLPAVSVFVGIGVFECWFVSRMEGFEIEVAIRNVGGCHFA